jgi:preprotein translocase SecE subunit
MATAVEPSSTPQPRTPSSGSGLLVASLVGTVYVLAALAVVLYAVPALWAQYVHPQLGADATREGILRWAFVLAVFAGLVWFGASLVGPNSPKGMRGGIFLMVVTFLLAFLLASWATSRFEGPAGSVVSAVVVIAILFGAFRLFGSARGEGWMVALEEQGWFHASAYKRVLGRQVRRLTILGILIVGLTGVYSLNYQNSLPDHWDVTLPFAHTADGGTESFRLLPDAKYTVPILLFALTVWVAYRAVNMPQFAEFLIATEAEMNKVSWSTRKRLMQDTVVVLITTLLMTLFLLVVDLFWGWLLSRQTVGVLPARATNLEKGAKTKEAKW